MHSPIALNTAITVLYIAISLLSLPIERYMVIEGSSNRIKHGKFYR